MLCPHNISKFTDTSRELMLYLLVFEFKSNARKDTCQGAARLADVYIFRQYKPNSPSF
jgi:hypothetical protein